MGSLCILARRIAAGKFGECMDEPRRYLGVFVKARQRGIGSTKRGRCFGMRGVIDSLCLIKCRLELIEALLCLFKLAFCLVDILFFRYP